eukprot:superscaffoldBa00005272_g20121
MTGIQQSFSAQKQRNKSKIPECGNEAPSGQINILGKTKFPTGAFATDQMGVPQKSATQGEVAEEEEEEAWPLGEDGGERECWKRRRFVREREGARRVNADSSTKAATAAEGREEHGKRAKVKGTSGGFKFKAT